MSTLSNLGVRGSMMERLARLQPSSLGRWGRMTVHQMVCHLNDSFEVAAGARYASPATGLFQRTVMKWGALHMPVPWPKGVPTRPEIEQGGGGTPPADWDSYCSALRRWIAEFPDRRDFGQHPVFGPMKREEWMIWGFRHVDHHFRQFGV
ncbi:MAG TPA: DUF1569 domain-containing protein [Bryobacteraceae bacterium]|jgi:hypothetical protein